MQTNMLRCDVRKTIKKNLSSILSNSNMTIQTNNIHRSSPQTTPAIFFFGGGWEGLFGVELIGAPPLGASWSEKANSRRREGDYLRPESSVMARMIWVTVKNSTVGREEEGKQNSKIVICETVQIISV